MESFEDFCLNIGNLSCLNEHMRFSEYKRSR